MSIDSIGSQWRPNIACPYAQLRKGVDDAARCVSVNYVCPREMAPHCPPTYAYSAQVMADSLDSDMFDDSSSSGEGQAVLEEYENVSNEPAVRLGPVIKRLECLPNQKGCRA